VLLNNKRNGANHVVSLTSGSNRTREKIAESSDSVAIAWRWRRRRWRRDVEGLVASSIGGTWCICHGRIAETREERSGGGDDVDAGSATVVQRTHRCVFLSRKNRARAIGVNPFRAAVSQTLGSSQFRRDVPHEWYIHRCIRARDMRSADVSFLLSSPWSKTCRKEKEPCRVLARFLLSKDARRDRNTKFFIAPKRADFIVAPPSCSG